MLQFLLCSLNIIYTFRLRFLQTKVSGSMGHKSWGSKVEYGKNEKKPRIFLRVINWNTSINDTSYYFGTQI